MSRNNLNNPFNIRNSKRNNWLGQINYDKQYKAFVEFDTLEHGVRAGIILLRNYLKFGYTKPLTIIPRYAPETENNTQAYLFYISTFMPLDEPIKYPSHKFNVLCCAIARYESGTILIPSFISKLIKQFHL